MATIIAQTHDRESQPDFPEPDVQPDFPEPDVQPDFADPDKEPYPAKK